MTDRIRPGRWRADPAMIRSGAGPRLPDAPIVISQPRPEGAVEEQSTGEGAGSGVEDGRAGQGSGTTSTGTTGTGTTRAEGRGVVAFVALGVAGAALAVVLVLVSWASHERSEPGAGSFAQVEGAFTTAGLTVCSTSVAADPLAPGALASRTYVLAPAGTGCASDTATVVVDQFETASDRDAAARRFEVLNRPRGSGAVWTLGDTTVSVRGSGDSTVQAALAPALQAVGAR
ncbi:hypothetical protein [Pseudonocardia sp.]|uniref:hypothetical protein n=1 Tax=Pseudonocardia sp. TaxID=60912 RepID=UPI003D12FAF3